MKCKKHPLDISGTIGVCATCLRDRLLVLIAAQEHAQQSELHAPPPLIFPCSVSPYISRRKSDFTSNHSFSDQRFYSTPQLGPNRTLYGATGRSSKKKSSKFATFSRFFWHKSNKSELDTCANPPSTSSSWFPSFFSGKQKNKFKFTPGERRPCRAGDRGMSSERASCDGEDYDRSSSYSSDTSERWKRTPATAPATVIHRSKPNRNGSGMAFCLSPLVRASPNRNWNQKGVPPEMTFSGEIRVPVKPHLSTAASFCANRSRKLADFGRLNSHR